MWWRLLWRLRYNMWHHRSCIELCSSDYQLLQRSNVQWLCCLCDSINVNSFTFHSFDTDSNYYSPIQDSDITLDSIRSSVFSPLKTSSPHLDTTQSVPSNSFRSHGSTRLSSSRTFPRKQNLRVLNVNCRSVTDKSSELAAALAYLKPDIVCGTESWLRGVKPGCNPELNYIRSSEVFPSVYKAYRNDRGSHGVGFFILVRDELVSIEQP